MTGREETGVIFLRVEVNYVYLFIVIECFDDMQVYMYITKSMFFKNIIQSMTSEMHVCRKKRDM